jgi:sugar O-acyltransferase (sialic acid O-acetyltransferase NeuD family)
VSPQGVYVVGTRTFAAEVVDFARDAGLDVLGLIEAHDRATVGQVIHGLPVTGLEELPAGGPHTAIVGTGETDRTELVRRLLDAGWQLAGLTHPRAHLAPSSTIGTGTVVGPAAVVGACAAIGEHAVLGRGALVGHHTEVGPFCTLGPGANVAGNVRIEAGVTIAMGAVVRDHTTVGAAATVAMGAVVVGDVPAGVEVRGVPARPVADSAREAGEAG